MDDAIWRVRFGRADQDGDYRHEYLVQAKDSFSAQQQVYQSIMNNGKDRSYLSRWSPVQAELIGSLLVSQL